MASIKDVARVANVSVSTVSHVINKTRFVSDGTAQRVAAAIDQLDFQPSHVAQALKSNQTRTLGMVVTSSTNPFFAQVVSGVEEGCFQSGYSLLLGNVGDTDGRQAQCIETLFRKRIDALVLMTSQRDPVTAQQLLNSKIPKVVLDADPIPNGCSIGDDSFEGAILATQHLIARGHRRIGALTGPTLHFRSDQRLAGYRQALMDAGITPQSSLVEHAPLDAAGGYAATLRMLAQPEPPTALFAFNDLMALGAYRAAFERGLTIPHDLAIIGYDDIEIARHLVPSLSTVRQGGFDMGLQAASIIINHLQNGADIPPQLKLEPELIVRESTA